eukprot:gb/GECG01010209.1/.p1 GENE.gb/GECG01010209.1/~~gb/GECG01010209.1/.p1  ORF type:complete len:660 (+),score=51.34 gb/GECG01010209.1/:1-1980(+)
MVVSRTATMHYDETLVENGASTTAPQARGAWKASSLTLVGRKAMEPFRCFGGGRVAISTVMIMLVMTEINPSGRLAATASSPTPTESTVTSSPSASRTSERTHSPTASPSMSMSPSATMTETITPNITHSPTSSASASETATITPNITASPTSSVTSSSSPTATASKTETSTSTPDSTSTPQASYVSVTPSSIPDKIPTTPIGYVRQRVRRVQFCAEENDDSIPQNIATVPVEDRVAQTFYGDTSIVFSKAEEFLEPGQSCRTLRIRGPGNSDTNSVGESITMAQQRQRTGEDDYVYVLTSATISSVDGPLLLAKRTTEGRFGVEEEGNLLYILGKDGENCPVMGSILAYAFNTKKPTLMAGVSECSAGTTESPQAVVTSIDSSLESNATIVKSLPVFNPMFARSPCGKYALAFDRTQVRPIAFVCEPGDEEFTICTSFRLYLDNFKAVQSAHWMSDNYLMFYGIGVASNTTTASVTKLRNFPSENDPSAALNNKNVFAERGNTDIDLSLLDGFPTGQVSIRSAAEAHLPGSTASGDERNISFYLIGSTPKGNFAFVHTIEGLRFSSADDIGFLRDTPWIMVVIVSGAGLIVLSGLCILCVVKLVKRKSPKPYYEQPTDQMFKEQTGRNMSSFRQLDTGGFQSPVNPLAAQSSKNNSLG